MGIDGPRGYKLRCFLERLDSSIKDTTNVVDSGEVCKEGAKIGQFTIVGIAEPSGHRDGVIRVEDVRGGWIVNDDGVLDVTTELG